MAVTQFNKKFVSCFSLSQDGDSETYTMIKKQMAKKRAARILEVVRSSRITPNMLRITLGGADMEDFPEGH